ncbi:hypothetical protein DFH29DRAFT_402887 [Suillus ampliporus]|nr:hypothetical protein DFH29DRAFT_402887 [Suillus ampliporus]
MSLLSIRSCSGHQNPAYYLVSFFFVLFDYVTAPVLRRQARIIFLNPPCAIPYSLCPLFTHLLALSWCLVPSRRIRTLSHSQISICVLFSFFLLVAFPTI